MQSTKCTEFIAMIIMMIYIRSGVGLSLQFLQFLSVKYKVVHCPEPLFLKVARQLKELRAARCVLQRLKVASE